MLPLIVGRIVSVTSFVLPSSRRNYVLYGRRTIVWRLFSSSSSVSNSNESEVEISPADHNTQPLKQYNPQELDSGLAQTLKSQGITQPTPIQAYGIPLLRKGYDVMASAQTGTGKTLLFSIPILERLWQSRNRSKSSKGPTALILNPTRELALQTAAAIEGLAKQQQNPKIKVALATGGAPVGQQRSQIQKPHDILVATPGRLLQFLDDRSLSLRDVQDVVCDESDRMVDLGFEPQLRRIANSLLRNNNQDKQTLLCSATFPPDVQRVAADFLKSDYYFIAVGRVGATHTSIAQTLQWADTPQRKSQLALEEIKKFIKTTQNQSQQPTHSSKSLQQSQVIVFCNTKEEAERMGSMVRKQISPKVRVVTGDKTQVERNRSLDDFRKGKIPILVATDVAARGLDVPTIGLVVQVDTPRDVDTYTHRVGRTGRAGAKGNAVAFVDGRSLGVATSLVDLLQEANQDVPSWLRGMSHVHHARMVEEEGAIAAGGGGGGGGGDTLSSGSSATTMPEESVSTDGTFSAQDFRSNAEAGSWGSERDTAYRSFDDEAYGSLDAAERILTLNETENIGLVGNSVREDDSSVSTIRVDTEAVDEMKSRIDNTFLRRQPSQELRKELKRISGSDNVGKKPNRNTLSKLSQRGSNQRLRFEYLGLFPFDDVSSLLMQRERENSMGRADSKLPKVLMVAEKPSIAKAIADALSGPRGPRQKRGISRALPVYEFTSNNFLPSQVNSEDSHQKQQPHKITVTSVVGHVFSLGFDKNERQEKQDPSDYFRMPVVKQEEGTTAKLRVVDHLRALAADCDHLVLWLDCDAEGENIAHEVIGVTRRAIDQKVARDAQANPDSAPQRRVHRAQFSAISKEALIEAFGDLGEPDALLSQSVDARQELDLRVGVALTRLLTWRCVGLARSRYSAATKFISYGPCQTPALSFCASRAREIEAFVPEPYWKVHVTTKSPALNLRWIPPTGSEVASNRKRKRRSKDGEQKLAEEESASFDMDAAEQMVVAASTQDSYATVVEVEEVSETLGPPLGLNTVALLAAGSKAMGMSPKKVMQVAEKLYSGGYISYPRTETTKYDPRGFDARNMLRDHRSHPNWGKTASYLLRAKYSKSGRPPQRGHNAGDHPPITCLKAATREQISNGAEWRVYEFVVRTFLGSLSDELQYTRQVASLQVGGKGATDSSFVVQQIQVDNLGFAGACPWVLKDIGAESRNRNGDEKKNIKFREGMKLPIANARREECQTRSPAFLQEHELIELMDKNKIGTDASMATHVNNIVERGYVALCDEVGDLLRPPRPPRPGQKQLPRQIGRFLVPTSLGRSLVDLFDAETESEVSDDVQESPALLSRPAIRAQMEEEVKEIALGKLDKTESLKKNLAWFEARYNELEGSLSRRRTQEFGRTLVPINQSLRYWKKLGAFEDRPEGSAANGRGPSKKSRGKQQAHRGRPKGGGGNKTKSGRWNRTHNKKTAPAKRAGKPKMAS